jgi:hypothetical protein
VFPLDTENDWSALFTDVVAPAAAVAAPVELEIDEPISVELGYAN